MPQDPVFKLYDIIDQIQDEQTHEQVPKIHYSAVVFHFYFKAAVLALVGLSQYFDFFFTKKITTQLMLLFIVFEFWFTKSVSGKRMVGYWWYFGEDQHGQQRLFFECRPNAEDMGGMQAKLFWIIQFAYTIVGFLYMLQPFFLIPNNGAIDFRKIQVCLIAQASGICNIFFYLKITDRIAERQEVLKIRLGMDSVRKLGLGSITTHY